VRVAFLGAFDPGYPRVRVLQEGLVEHGVDARLYPLSAKPIAREATLIRAWLSGAALADAFVVPSFAHRDVPPISLLTHAAGAPLLFDPLVSRWDTQVRDLVRVRAGSVAAARLRASDAVAMRLADVVLCDTWEHGELFASEFGVPRSKLARVPVGADRAAFALGASRAEPRAREGAPLHVVYIGGFLPLHGVEAVIGAVALLEARRGAGFARFTLVGSGMTAHRADRDAAVLGLRSIRRVPRVPYPEALAILADADLAGVPVVTRRSPAVVELFPESPPMALVPPGHAEALAASIEALAEDPARRAALGAAGREAALRFATPERVGAALLEAIRRPRGGGR
jgi:glycosyltransferase involved in cell wall biosynthesis